MTKTQQVKQHLLKHNSITALEALKRYRCIRLAPRIFELRESGFSVITVPVKTRNGARIAKYVMG